MKHVSQIDLDAYRLDLLADENKVEVTEHLASCARCAQALREIEDSASDFAASFNTAGLATDAIARHEAAPEPRARRAWWVPALSLVAASILAVLVWPRPVSHVRTKGNAGSLELFVHTPGGPAPVSGPIAPGSSIKVRFDPANHSHFRILWETPPEAPTSLYPDETASAARPSGPGPQWLPQMIDLDKSRQEERLYMVACPRDFTAAHATQVARSPEAARDCDVQSVRVVKGPP